MYSNMNDFIESVKLKNPNEIEFHQAVHEVIESIWDFVIDNPQYQYNAILERITEPERVLMFRVPWMDDKGIIQIKMKNTYFIHLNIHKFIREVTFINIIYISFYSFI